MAALLARRGNLPFPMTDRPPVHRPAGTPASGRPEKPSVPPERLLGHQLRRVKNVWHDNRDHDW